MSDLLDDLADMFPDVISAQAVTTNADGDYTASGSPLSINCYISVRNMLVRDERGQEVVSSAQATLNANNNLTVTGYRFTLPSRFNPRSNLRAVGIKKVSDEDGAHHEVVYFP